MGGEPVPIDELDRVRYHLGLVHGANYAITLIALAMQILRGAGVEHPDRVLRPLLNASIDNALRMGDAALTGPVARGDVGTVVEHLEVLTHESEDVASTYRALAKATVARARAGGRLSESTAARIDAVLDQPGGNP